jgi:hypothetical protein
MKRPAAGLQRKPIRTNPALYDEEIETKCLARKRRTVGTWRSSGKTFVMGNVTLTGRIYQYFAEKSIFIFFLFDPILD